MPLKYIRIQLLQCGTNFRDNLMNLHDTSKTKFTQLRANTDTVFNQMAIKLVISPLFEMLIHIVRTYACDSN